MFFFMLQACRKRMYNSKEHIMDKDVQKIVSLSDDLGEVCEYLIHLMSQSSSDTNSGNKRLFEEIEMFFSTSIAEDNS